MDGELDNLRGVVCVCHVGQEGWLVLKPSLTGFSATWPRLLFVWGSHTVSAQECTNTTRLIFRLAIS